MYRHGCSNRSEHSGGRDFLPLLEEMWGAPLRQRVYRDPLTLPEAQDASDQRPMKMMRTLRTLGVPDP